MQIELANLAIILFSNISVGTQQQQQQQPTPAGDSPKVCSMIVRIDSILILISGKDWHSQAHYYCPI